MSLYNEQTNTETITTTTFDRSYRVVVENPNNGIPTIRYEEETIKRVTGEDDKSLGAIGSVSESLTTANASESFQLKNPITGDNLGSTSTYGDLQVLLYSLYFHLADKRDNP